MKKVLITSCYVGPEAGGGGVGTILDCVLSILRPAGFEITIASGIPYSIAPELSVPFWQILNKRPGIRETHENRIRKVALGAYFPELEWTYNFANSGWEQLINEHDFYFVVGGACLPALPFVLAKVPCLGWVGTPYFEDKVTRTSEWPVTRKLWDRIIVSPIGQAIEKNILRTANIMTHSEYTTREFKKKVPEKIFMKMPFPIDQSSFHSRGRNSDGATIGFLGRLDDPRKNISLLFKAISSARKKIKNLKLRLNGTPHSDIQQLIHQLGIAQSVEWFPYKKREELPVYYRSLDLFVIPSTQEGLCIAGLEAMACGCPVISTRCGGPEEYVRDGENGYLVNGEAGEMADKICDLLANAQKKERFSTAAVQTICENYTREIAEKIFWEQFHKVYPQAVSV